MKKKLPWESRGYRVFFMKPHAYVANGVLNFFEVCKNLWKCSILPRMPVPDFEIPRMKFF